MYEHLKNENKCDHAPVRASLPRFGCNCIRNCFPRFTWGCEEQEQGKPSLSEGVKSGWSPEEICIVDMGVTMSRSNASDACEFGEVYAPPPWWGSEGWQSLHWSKYKRWQCMQEWVSTTVKWSTRVCEHQRLWRLPPECYRWTLLAYRHLSPPPVLHTVNLFRFLGWCVIAVILSEWVRPA